MKIHDHMIRVFVLVCFSVTVCGAAEEPVATEPLARVVDLDLGETSTVTLCDGSQATIKLLDLSQRPGYRR
jgi:hypothetical protein